MSRFVKISSTGEHLGEDATEFSAVLDTTTQLIWSAADVADEELNFENAAKVVTALDLAGFTDWRLPNDVELLSIVDRSRYSPAIDTAFFPAAKSDWYWTSKDTAWSSVRVFIVNFGSGYVSGLLRHHGAFVRAVRSVSPASQ